MFVKFFSIVATLMLFNMPAGGDVTCPGSSTEECWRYIAKDSSDPPKSYVLFAYYYDTTPTTEQLPFADQFVILAMLAKSNKRVFEETNEGEYVTPITYEQKPFLTYSGDVYNLPDLSIMNP